MLWYIDRDSDAILITSEKWRKSLIRTSQEEKKNRTIKIGGEDTSLFCFSWSFSWSGSFGLYFWIIVFKVCPSMIRNLFIYRGMNRCHKTSQIWLVFRPWSCSCLYQNLKPCLAWSSNFVYATNVYNATCL